MEEEPIHLDAFETYFKLRQSGKGKTEAAIGTGSEHGRTKSTIFEWKKNFNWDDREAVRSADINREVQQNTNSVIIDNKTSYLIYAHKLLDKILIKDKDGNVTGINLDIKSISDFEKVTKLCLLLQGEDTDRDDNGLKEFADVLQQSREKAGNQ
jgi:hypothetical protein